MLPVPCSRLYAVVVYHIPNCRVTCTRHATKLSNWLLKSYDVFSARKRQKKVNLIQFSSEQNVTENFPVHVTRACSRAFLFRSVPVRGKFSVSGNPPLDTLKKVYMLFFVSYLYFTQIQASLLVRRGDVCHCH